MTNELNNLLKQLQAAQTDAALFERLQAAPVLAARLAVEYDQLAEATEQQENERRAAEVEAEYAKIRNLAVSVRSGNSMGDPGLLGRGYDITWTTPGYDSRGEPEPRKMRCDAFITLYENHPYVFDYLRYEAPHLIPADIMELAPGNPSAAFNEYFISRKRGYCRGPVAA